MTVRGALYALGFLFVTTMLALTVYIMVSPNVVTQSCTTSSSQSWVILTVIAAGMAIFIMGAAHSEERG